MNRREFLFRLGGTAWLLVFPVGCGTKLADLTATSAADSTLHSHTFTIPLSALKAPSAGYTGDTSVVSTHSHTMTFTSAELTTLAKGDAVTKVSGVAGGHAHTFTFKQAA